MKMVKRILGYFFELDKLEFTPRSGWNYLGIRDPESVMEHSCAAAQIAFVLAIMEGYKNPCHCATLLVFHDTDEDRSLDQNRVSKCYNKTDHEQAMRDQTFGLGEVGHKVALVWNEFEEGKTQASIIARDADVLQMMVRARKLMVSGYPDAVEWIDSGEKRLQTKSANSLAEELRDADPNAWWKEFKSRRNFADTVGM